ncbi:MAG: xanthine dehydrogenase family protein molybdopterin-binding subunit, partial [Myxococcales bacterium]|nr:xanthine dehydrogenase family protein molybdopterin-binding subunit [Myxococcales bacterium]
GGGFGRRAVLEEIREVVEIARHTSPHPVQLAWTREDDLRTDWYRSAAAQRVEVGLDAEGDIVAWRHHVATPSHGGDEAAAGRVDDYAIDGARPAYRVGAVEVRWSDVASPIPTGIWRSVAHGYTAFAVEAMLDEVARATERDPLALRLALLSPSAREREVLERVGELCDWDAGPPEGRARGLAVHACFGSVCAQVAEVSLVDELPRVHRVWAAVECGRVINPLGVEAQIMGGIVFGLSAVLYGRIDVEAGRVRQSNFHDAQVLRMDEHPEIQVAIVSRDAPPGGVGEVGVPMIAPAVANALARLRGQPVYRLPLGPAGITSR